MEALIQIDHALFLFFNKTISNPIFDWLMPFITDSGHIMIGLLGTYVIYLIAGKDKKRAFLLIFVSLIVFGLCDSISSQIFKPLFGRLRPCNPMNFVDGGHTFLPGAHLLDGLKTSKGFPSSHATNAIGVALFWTLFFPKKWFYFMIPGVAIAFSRIYVGVHYPFDIISGGILGSSLAIMVYYIYKWIATAVNKRKAPQEIETTAEMIEE